MFPLHVEMEELDSLESLTEENGVGKQTKVARKKNEVRATTCGLRVLVFSPFSGKAKERAAILFWFKVDAACELGEP